MSNLRRMIRTQRLRRTQVCDKRVELVEETEFDLLPGLDVEPLKLAVIMPALSIRCSWTGFSALH